jgi:hypothetical protein
MEKRNRRSNAFSRRSSTTRQQRKSREQIDEEKKENARAEVRRRTLQVWEPRLALGTPRSTR